MKVHVSSSTSLFPSSISSVRAQKKLTLPLPYPVSVTRAKATMSDIPATIVTDDMTNIDASKFELVDVELEYSDDELEDADRRYIGDLEAADTSSQSQQEEVVEDEEKQQDDQNKRTRRSRERCIFAPPCFRLAGCIITTSLLVLFTLLLMSTLAIFDGERVVLSDRQPTMAPTLPPTVMLTSRPTNVPTALMTRLPRESPSPSPSSLPTITPPPTGGA